jgi:hypothetical protein
LIQFFVSVVGMFVMLHLIAVARCMHVVLGHGNATTCIGWIIHLSVQVVVGAIDFSIE